MSGNLRVRISQTGSILTTAPVTLANTSVAQVVSPNRLDALSDVYAPLGSEVDGAVPVFNAALGKYEIKQITANVVVTDIDGGIF